jgi:hypothetical protein
VLVKGTLEDHPAPEAPDAEASARNAAPASKSFFIETSPLETPGLYHTCTRPGEST